MLVKVALCLRYCFTKLAIYLYLDYLPWRQPPDSLEKIQTSAQSMKTQSPGKDKRASKNLDCLLPQMNSQHPSTSPKYNPCHHSFPMIDQIKPCSQRNNQTITVLQWKCVYCVPYLKNVLDPRKRNSTMSIILLEKTYTSIFSFICRASISRSPLYIMYFLCQQLKIVRRSFCCNFILFTYLCIYLISFS